MNRREIRRIVDLQIRRLADQLERQSISLQITEAARNRIAAEGFDPVYGARPLKRVIQQRIQNPLAGEILRGGIGESETMTIDCQNGEFTFARANAMLGAEQPAAVRLQARAPASRWCSAFL